MITPDKATKGYLAILDGPYVDTVFVFPINPKEIKDSHSPNYADHQIIGRGHPKSHYTSGGPRVISFALDMDAKNEMLCTRNSGVMLLGPRDTPEGDSFEQRRATIGDPVDKLNESIRFLQALTYPRAFTRQRSAFGELLTGPHPILFVYGPDKRIRCILRKADVTEKEWTQEGRVLRASMEIELHEQPLKPVTFQSYLRGKNMVDVDDLRVP